jgi:hypothetical protein
VENQLRIMRSLKDRIDAGSFVPDLYRSERRILKKGLRRTVHVMLQPSIFLEAALVAKPWSHLQATAGTGGFYHWTVWGREKLTYPAIRS